MLYRKPFTQKLNSVGTFLDNGISRFQNGTQQLQNVGEMMQTPETMFQKSLQNRTQQFKNFGRGVVGNIGRSVGEIVSPTLRSVYSLRRGLSQVPLQLAPQMQQFTNPQMQQFTNQQFTNPQMQQFQNQLPNQLPPSMSYQLPPSMSQFQNQLPSSMPYERFKGGKRNKTKKKKSSQK